MGRRRDMEGNRARKRYREGIGLGDQALGEPGREDLRQELKWASGGQGETVSRIFQRPAMRMGVKVQGVYESESI